MWRRYGDVIYAVLLSIVLIAETAALGSLTLAFALGLSVIPGLETPSLVLGAVIVTALAFVAVATYVVLYHSFSERRERLRLEAMDQWTERWVKIVLEHRPRPDPPLPAAAVDSLLDLRDVLVGPEGQRAEQLIREYGLGHRLVARASGAVGRGPLRWLRGWIRRRRSSRRVAERLDALESLAKARMLEAFSPMLVLLRDPELRIRLMALRGLARTLARMPTEADRHRAGAALCDRLRSMELPGGAIEEALLLLESAAQPVIGNLLQRPRNAPVSQDAWSADRRGFRRQDRARVAAARSLLKAALDAAGRMKLLSLADQVGAHVHHQDPEVRASAIRALGKLGYVTPAAEDGLRRALQDQVDFVRVQAAHAAMLLHADVAAPALWDLLGDQSWWVRRAAAQTLGRMTERGVEDLERAARAHPDRYARHMAAQVLLEAGRLDTASAQSLQEA